MGLLDHQLMFGVESTYGTAVTPTRTYEYNSEGIDESYGRTEGDPLRVGTHVMRSDRFAPYFIGAAGSIQFDVMTKGFGVLLQHMLGGINTSGPTDSAYTHTATMADLFGKSLTCQLARPLNPSGTVQPFTYEGGKVTEFTLSNSVEGNLVLDLGLDFEQVATGTALASAAYPSSMENFTWAGGELLVGGADVGFVVSEVSVAVNNNLNVDRRSVSGGTDKKEPTAGRREVTFSLSGDFTSLAHRNRAASATAAGALAELEFTWTAPTLIGTTTYPSLKVTIPVGRFDTWSAPTSGAEGITQELSGMGRYNGTDSPISIEYVTADATP
jgi:hypothetical protein